MQLIEVQDSKTRKDFLDVARIIYKNDPHWICPLDEQINAIFDPSANIFFNHGEAVRWILQDENGKLIGRVATFINKNKAYGFQQPTGGMGFFECINDQKAAFMLFDCCREWLSDRGMEAMDGPINFGENDNFWGLLVEGFVHPGYGMNYNFPYYQNLFEAYGFKFYFEQVSNVLDLTKPFPERFWKIAGWVLQKPEYSFRHFSFKEKDKFLDDFIHVYNTAWVHHENFTPISRQALEKIFTKAKYLIDEEMIWFAYADNEPIAFEIMFPDFNQIFKFLNGKTNLWAQLKIIWLKYRKTITRSRIVIMGVVPKFQKSGIESAIFWHMDKAMKTKPWITEIELSWVGDFNPKMRALHTSVGSSFAKRHVTYRRLFKDDLSYTRSTIIPMDTREKSRKSERNDKDAD